ncbi:Transmembrane protein 62 [Tyrophagus putrescentiae]|nr:Transmembrane protein 62 [Tyrophagus putrescentiae]
MFAIEVHPHYQPKYTDQPVSSLIWLVSAGLIAAVVIVVKQWTSTPDNEHQQFELAEQTGQQQAPGPRNILHKWRAKILVKMLSRTTLFFLALLIPTAIFVAIFVSKLNTDNDANNSFIVDPAIIANDHAETLNDKTENLFWFIQVSDTHFNSFNDRNRKVDLQDFCKNMIPLVGPSALVLSGDITDSRSPDPMGSDQFYQEWLYYNETRHKCMEYNPSVTWLDIRGNHDNFNVYNSFNSFYKNFTVQGNLTEEGRSYRYEVKADDGKSYSFIAVDACLKPGIRRPFNFVGRLDDEELERVRRLKKESENTTYTVYFGHYPTSAIQNPHEIRSIISGPYLCGHYHNFHGISPHMYSTQPEGFLEAELGDWKANRMFRIGVVDGGLFTFSDFNYNRLNYDYPLIVISNPRSILYQMEMSEPFWRSSRSSHIRALVFSKRPLVHVNACITNQKPKANGHCLESFELKHVKGPLWVAPWTATKYQKGLFYITVSASNDHEESEMSSPFSFDQTKPPYTLAGRISLRISFSTIGFYLLCWGVIIAVIPLSVIRVFTYSDNAYFRHMFNLSRRSYFRKLIFKAYILSHTDKLFFPLVFVPIYLCIGPWFIGRFVEDKIGVSFMWGTYIEGYLLPVSFTFIFSSIFLFIFHIPLTALMAGLVSSRCMKILSEVQLSASDDNAETAQSKVNCCNLEVFQILLIVVIIILQGLASTMYYFAYGYLAMLTNVFAWLALVYVIFLSTALRLKKEDFKKWL